MPRNLRSHNAEAVALAAAVYDADADGATIDLQGYRGCHFLASVGVGGITFDVSNYLELEVEESDDGSTWTDVADTDLLGYVAGGNDGCFASIKAEHAAGAVYEAEYIGEKRYVRVHAEFTGTHGTGTPIAIGAMKVGSNR